MFYLHAKNLLSSSECERLIALSNSKGFEEAPVNYYGEMKKISSIRNNERLEYRDHQLAKTLEDKLQTQLKETFPFNFERFSYSQLNDHFRFYKYKPEQYFKPHVDGHILDGENESQITALFYLNTTNGGETILMPHGVREKSSYITIHPEVGDVLLFEHGMWHEGKSVTSGEKYVLRSDLFYKFGLVY